MVGIVGERPREVIRRVLRYRFRVPRMPWKSRERHRSWPQLALVGFNALLAVACLGAAAGLFYTRVLVQRIDTVSVSQATRNDTRDAKDPINYLIIGTDSAATLDESDPVNNGRDNFGELADVIMVLRVDPRSGEAWLLSIPRDSLVPISPSGRDSKINSALGGPNGAADLIKHLHCSDASQLRGSGTGRLSVSQTGQQAKSEEQRQQVFHQNSRWVLILHGQLPKT